MSALSLLLESIAFGLLLVAGGAALTGFIWYWMWRNRGEK